MLWVNQPWRQSSPKCDAQVNNRAAKHINPNLIDRTERKNKQIYSYSWRLQHLSTIDRLEENQQVNRTTQQYHQPIGSNQHVWTVHPITTEYTFFSSTHKMYT